MIRLYRLLKIFISGISFPEYRFRTAAFILFLCVLGGIFFYIQSGSDFLVGYDSYFHIRYSQLLGERGYIGSLPWLQFTIHHDFFIDHHLLWHYLLIPFTFGDLISGGQAATLCFFLIAGASLYLVLQKAGVRLPILWSLAGLFSSYHFLYRMSLLRVQSIALALLMIVFLLSSKKIHVGVYRISWIRLAVRWISPVDCYYPVLLYIPLVGRRESRLEIIRNLIPRYTHSHDR